jgi:signal transduction histidine kinase
MQMEFQPIRLDTLLREVTERAQSRHENLTIQLELNSHPIVQADSTRIAQVFDNLLTNAVKYAPGSGVAISLDEHDNQAHILVKDSGPGIAPDHLGRLFERFFRVPGTPASTRGTGLGLYICRQLVQAHRGEITAESQVGQGTTFHIYLPIQQTKSESKTHSKEEKQT